MYNKLKCNLRGVTLFCLRSVLQLDQCLHMRLIQRVSTLLIVKMLCYQSRVYRIDNGYPRTTFGTPF